MSCERYCITRPVRLIELFSGYGSQALALKYLGVDFTHYKTCEWAIKSIQAYKDIHFTNDNKDYSKGISKEQLIERLHYFGISRNYNDPMTLEQIKRLNEDNLRIIFNNIVATNNLVNIQNVKGEDLEIVDTDKYDYILTYSFPCQDLSLAGRGKGMSDTSTRSGLLWEVERILKECKKLKALPQILLMENVSQVHGKKHLDDFNKWIKSLEKLGYKNYYKDLIATDYGIPQTRKRTFMISILGNYLYEFPNSVSLELKLKDMLEDDVDEKYYLSDRMITTSKNGDCVQSNNKSPTLDTRCDCLGIVVYDDYNSNIRKDQTTIGTLTTNCGNNAERNGWKLIEKNDLRIRKLTPKECFRLMGVKDEDFEKVKVNQSDSSLYHLAGDSIVVNVLMAIFKELF